jgi:hypothetical protein
MKSCFYSATPAETRWKGSAAKSLGLGSRVYYSGSGEARNGVGIVVREGLLQTVREVIRVMTG